MNGIELEVFRADEKASRGITSADIAAAAKAYDPDKAPAAICIGHPKNDTPAYGVIDKLRADGNRLFATLKDVKDKVVSGIKGGDLLNRSMAFFGKDHEANPVPGVFYPRHLGFIGASAPGIPGLTNLKKALAFSAEDDLEVDGDPAPAIILEQRREPTPTFSVHEESTVDPNQPTAEQLAERERKLKTDETAFAARVEEQRKTGNKTLVDGLVTAGRVTPAEADKLAHIFNALDAEPLEFEAGKEKRPAAAELAAIFAARDPVVDTSGERKTPLGSPEFSAEDAKDPAKISAAARALMKDNEDLTFEAAVAQVTGQDKE
jgi:hypothetical protein